MALKNLTAACAKGIIYKNYTIYCEENILKRRFSVLHISDLHIDSHGSSYQIMLRRLLEDIQTQLSTMYKNRREKWEIILVVTGDIVEKGMYDKHSRAALAFFNDLKQKLSEIIKPNDPTESIVVSRVFFAAGNHDRAKTDDSITKCLINERRYYTEDRRNEDRKKEGLRKKYLRKEDRKKEEEIYTGDDLFNKVTPLFARYVEFTKEVCKIFDCTPPHDSSTYYSKYVPINNCHVVINAINNS